MTQTKTVLLPCPFCGCTDISVDDNGHDEWLKCDWCGATGGVDPAPEYEGKSLDWNWNRRASRHQEPGEPAEWQATVGTTLNFFASVIKSGETWTATCQAEFDKAHAALRAASILKPGVKASDEMIYAAMVKADELDFHLDDVDARELINAAIYAAPQPTPVSPLPVGADAVRDVLAERKRQVEAEGWTPEHDDQHTDGEMAQAAACYAAYDEDAGPKHGEHVLKMWPWADEWLKLSDRRRNLVKAGALILAEIERIDRLTETSK